MLKRDQSCLITKRQFKLKLSLIKSQNLKFKLISILDDQSFSKFERFYVRLLQKTSIRLQRFPQIIDSKYRRPNHDNNLIYYLGRF